MLVEVKAPRINNNDDDVRVARLCVAIGADVVPGDLLAEVETDKAVVGIESSQSGKVLGINGRAGDVVRVGSVLFWIGTEAEDSLPPASDVQASRPGNVIGPTAKAKELLTKYGLRVEDVHADGERLTAQDVERFAAARAPHSQEAPSDSGFELAAGRHEHLSPQERAMSRAVLWHRHEAVPAYLEYAYDDRAWREHAQTFAEQHRLLTSPLLGLMAHRLVSLARTSPKLNSTMSADQRWQYSSVNLGFTVQARGVLHLVVVHDADTLTAIQFVTALTSLQRSALAHTLRAEQVSGATIGLTSMEKWSVSRHMPILPAYVSLMVAHSVDAKGQALLGATYDHRVLNGGDVALTLKQMADPDGAIPPPL